MTINVGVNLEGFFYPLNILIVFINSTMYSPILIILGTLVSTLKEAQPTIFFGVPRVWEKIREKMVMIGKSNTGIKKAVGMWAKKTGLDFNKAKIGGKKTRSISFKVSESFPQVKIILDPFSLPLIVLRIGNIFG